MDENCNPKDKTEIGCEANRLVDQYGDFNVFLYWTFGVDFFKPFVNDQHMSKLLFQVWTL